jgi:cysteinyl-tRNA synthetase
MPRYKVFPLAARRWSGYTLPPMDIHFYNTLTHRKERFTPIKPGVVSMYNCGPTVYDYAHIGNFRTFIFADVLRRFLELSGHKVKQVMNITDVGHMTDDQLADGGGEDKMAAAAARLKASKKQGAALVDNPDDPYAVAEFFTKAFIQDAKLLGLKIADEYPGQMPRATEHVAPSMIPMIKSLIEKDHAYVADDGAVYFAVQSFPDYGKLSGNSLDQLKGGAGGRVQDTHQTHKRHPADFLLWKPDKTHLMKWDSPWGVGYPGWHIECSAMARALLGQDTIDIHTGGEDNIFPHHECEIAQSCCATGQPHFARFWMHSRFLLVEGEKMSKSKGNFHTVRDVLEGKVTGRPVDPAVLRFELLKGHYRSNINFTAKGLSDSASAVQKLRDATYRWTVEGSVVDSEGMKYSVIDEFKSALADDLNMSAALGVLFSWLKYEPGNPNEAAAVLMKANHILRFLSMGEEVAFAGGHAGSSNLDIKKLCGQLDAARAERDFDKADTLRQQLIDAGYDVKTTKDGTVASKRLA